jgi:hypothetical protein
MTSDNFPLPHPPRWPPRHRPKVISLGPPLTLNKEGKVMVEFASNVIAYFPLLVNGAAPPAGDTFTATSTAPDICSVAIGTMPSGADQGDPAVVVTALTLDGGAGGFTVQDSNGDNAATESFTITKPAGTIEVDDPNVVFETNPSPPTS